MTFETSQNCQKVLEELIVNSFSRPNVTQDNLEHYKIRLVTKGFTQKDMIDYKHAFSPISKKDSFRIIMALITYDLELYQMDTFFNQILEEVVYMN